MASKCKHIHFPNNFAVEKLAVKRFEKINNKVFDEDIPHVKMLCNFATLPLTDMLSPSCTLCVPCVLLCHHWKCLQSKWHAHL